MATEVQDEKTSSASPSKLNVLGLVGLILSLLGAFPLGLIVSLFGLRRQPRGLAIAGTVLGGLGTLAIVLVFAMFGPALFTFWKEGAKQQPVLQTQASLLDASDLVESYRKQNSALPDNETGNRLIAGVQDAWGKALRYELDATGSKFTIRSGGGDGQFDTADDITPEQAEMLDPDNLDLDIDFGGGLGPDVGPDLGPDLQTGPSASTPAPAPVVPGTEVTP